MQLRSIHTLAGVLALGILTAATLATGGAQNASKPPLPYSVEDSWRGLGTTHISNDGKWLAYTILPEQGDDVLVVRNLVTGQEYREARGGGPDSSGFGFTANGRFVVFLVEPKYAAVKAAEKAKKKASEQPKADLGILDLSTGSVVRYERVTSFKLPRRAGDVVGVLKEPPASTADDDATPLPGNTKPLGAQLVVRDLDANTDQTFDNVVDYGLTPDGKWLAFATNVPLATPSPVPSASPSPSSSPSTQTPALSADNGVYVHRIASSDVTPILLGPALFANLTFSNDHPEFAFISDLGSHTAKRPAWRLYYWDARARDGRAVELVNRSTPGIIPGYMASAKGSLTFTKDGTRLFFFTAPIPTPKPPPNAEPPLKVDIWWSKGPELPSTQKAEANMQSGIPAMAWLPERRFLQLGTRTIDGLGYNDNPNFALGLAGVPYQLQLSWRYANCDRYLYCDVYLDNLATGHRTKLETMTWFEPHLSPEGKYIVNFSTTSHTWYVIRTVDLHRTNLSVSGVHFEKQDWDQADPPDSYGIMGWSKGDKSVYVYDRYDVWAFDPDTGVGYNATAGYGRSHHVALRYVDMRPDQEYGYMPSFEQRSSDTGYGPIDATKPVILVGMNEDTEAQSLYHFSATATPQPPTLLTQQDVLFGFPLKARNADVVALTRERFDMEPNLYVTNMQFQPMRPISDVEPRQRQYAWGTSRIIWYTNADGRRLKAILTVPGNFDPHKKYPMLVFVYEDKSSTLNVFDRPQPEIGSEPTISRYASNGYVVLEPDIIYTVGHPGWSAVHCIVPAVQRVVSMGFVDPKRIGMAGHSWGGFQSEFVLTHTHLFAAIAGGAGLSDLLSWYGELRNGIGNPGAAHLEIFQGRMGGTLWDRFNLYLENSSVFSAPNATTPFLTLHNNTDSNVTQFQGIEMFLALRRLGKQAWLIDYNGEDHGIYASRDDQKDWTVHMDQFLDHYLKGEPAPAWMLHPINYDVRGTRQYLKLFEPNGD